MIAFTELATPNQALTLALYLSLTAPTDELSKSIADEYAEPVAACLETETVEACKAAALERAVIQWALEGLA
jgi:hypothetical protein